MERQDSIYDMNIGGESSFEGSSHAQSQQKPQQTALKIQFHPGFFCLFPSYLQKYNLNFGECYQSVVNSSRQIIKIRDNPEKIIRSNTNTLMKTKQIHEKHVQQKDIYIAYSSQHNRKQITKQKVSFNFKHKKMLKSIEETIEKYKKMNEQLITEKKNQFLKRRQQHQKKLQQQMRQKQKWENTMNQQQRQAMHRRKLNQKQQTRLKQQQSARQMQQGKQRARRQQQAILTVQNNRQSQQQYQQQQKIKNWIRQIKLAQRYQNEPQQNIWVSNEDFENYKKKWYSNNKGTEFKRNLQREIKCEIM